MNTAEAIFFRPKIWNTDKADVVVVVVTALVGMDVERENSNTKTFRLSRCRSATTTQSGLQSSATPRKRRLEGGNVLTLTSCVLRSDRAESVWMPTDLISTIYGSFNPFADKEAPAPGCSYFIYILKSFFRGDPGLCVCRGGGG